MLTAPQIEALLPLACAWAEDQERIILRDGEPLSTSQFRDARQVGVGNPTKVRLLRVASIPMPAHPQLRAAAESIRLISPLTAGLTLRYGIYVRAEMWKDRRLICHELVHTAQYERLGGFHLFLQQYLHECVTLGYPAAPMEQEAIATAQTVCGGESGS